MPGKQGAQAAEESASAYVPAAHGAQNTAPAALAVPAGQGTHSSGEKMASTELARPAGQLTQLEAAAALW